MPKVDDELAGPGAADEAPVEEERSVSRVKILLPLALVIMAGAAYAAYLHYRDQVSSDDAEVEAHVSAVAPKVAGNVIEVLVNDNQPVKAGQVLVRIDPRDYQARVDMARAAVAQAESQLRSARVVVPWTNETTESGMTAASAQLATAQVELERARASYAQSTGSDLSFAQANVRAREAANERAQADLARMKPLVAKTEISQLQFDSYTAAARVAQSELEAAQQKLASARDEATIRKTALDGAQTRVDQARAQLGTSVANRKQVDIRTADAGTASAAVAAARANLEAAELQLGYTTVVAPVDGMVTRKSVEVGQIVQPGQGLMTVVPLQDTWVIANFKETQLADVHPGQRVEIHVDMYGKNLGGRVDSIAGATGALMSLLPPENATGNFVKVVQRIPVKILVDRQSDLVLRPGMNVDVIIFTK
jgi:membrane fusion protein, multidrug efflux system